MRKWFSQDTLGKFKKGFIDDKTNQVLVITNVTSLTEEDFKSSILEEQLQDVFLKPESIINEDHKTFEEMSRNEFETLLKNIIGKTQNMDVHILHI